VVEDVPLLVDLAAPDQERRAETRNAPSIAQRHDPHDPTRPGDILGRLS
jgi:hypothetical protein